MKNSRRIILTALIGLFSLQFSFAQQTKIAVSIAYGNTSCNVFTSLGYVYKYGTDQKANYYGNASKAAEKSHPNNTRVITESNGYNGSKGSYLVIIEAQIKSYNGCDITKFGVGFGENYENALKAAKQFMSSRSDWQESKHGYDVRFSQKL